MFIVVIHVDINAPEVSDCPVGLHTFGPFHTYRQAEDFLVRLPAAKFCQCKMITELADPTGPAAQQFKQ